MRKTLLGTVVGKLTIIRLNHIKNGKSYWQCRCQCGNDCVVRSDALKSGKTISCGCFGKIKISDEEIFEMYFKYINENVSPSMLAKSFNCSPSTIIKKFKSKSLPIKKIGFANRKFHINETIFDIIDTEEKAYWLGFLYADGGVTIKNRTYVVRLSLAKQDQDMVEKFSYFIFGKNRLKFRKPSPSKIGTNTQDSVLVDVCSKYLAESLTKKGCMPNKTFLLNFPKWLDKKLYNHFIRGYFDGDGCIGIYNDENYRRARFNIVSTKDFLDELAIIFNKLKITSKQKLTNKVKEGKNCRTLWVSGNRQIEKLMNWIYKDANVFMGRKYQKYLELIKINQGVNYSCQLD